MGISEILQSALSSLWSHKVRTALTLLGMIVGVFAIITSVTAVKVIDVYFQERLNFLGSSTFNVSRYGEFVLLKPRWNMRNALLWGTPLLLLVGGISILFVSQRSRRPASPKLSDEEAAELDRILNSGQK